jgi:glycosyltransferase involved in cell wall biosynthesis
MKILQVINALRTGGAEKLIADLVPVMNTADVKVDVLLFYEAEGPFMDKLRNSNVNIIHIKSGNLYSPLNIFRAAKYFKDYDIVHAHLFPANYWVSLAKYLSPLSNRKVKLVLTEHSNSNRRFKKPYLRVVDWIIYRRYDRLIAITDSVREVLWKRVRHSSIQVVYSGVDVASLAAATPVTLPQGQINLLMAASFRNAKDHATVIRAVKQLDERYHLYLAGQGNTQNACKELVKELGLENRVHFMGMRKDVPGLMKAADLNILSSYWEGLSCVVLESMASLTPFLGTDVNGIKEMFVDNPYALFKTGDVDTLVEKIRKVTSDKALALEQSKINFEKVQQFDIRVMVSKYLAIYRSILNDK